MKGEKISIKYTIEAYIDNLKDHLVHKKELIIREYKFSNEEVDEDWKDYEQYMNVKKLIKNAAPKMADVLSPQVSMRISALPSTAEIKK